MSPNPKSKMQPQPSEASPLVPEDVPAEGKDRRTSRWDLGNALPNYFTLAVSQVTVALFSFSSVWLITRYLGSDGYGGIVAVLAASQLAQIFVNWTAVGLARYGVEEYVETGRIDRSFWARTIILLPNTFAFLATSVLWLPVVSNWLELPPGANRYVAAHFIVSAVWLHIQHAVQGAKLPRLNGVLVAIERILIFSILLSLVWAKRLDFFSALGAYIVSPLLMIAIGLFQIRNLISWRFNLDSVWLYKILKFSLPLIPFSLLGYFSTSYLDAIFIVQYLSVGDLGIYSVATQISGIFLQFPSLAGVLLLPLFVTLRMEGSVQGLNYFRNVLPSFTLVWGVGCVLISLAGYYIIPAIFGAEFAGAAKPLWILMAASAFSIPVALGYAALSNSISATYISMFASIFAAGVNLAANFLLIPRWGLNGSAWATLLAYMVSFWIFALLSSRAAKIPISWAFIAVLPSLSGAAVFSYYGSPWPGFAVCLSLSILVLYLFKRSVSEAMGIFGVLRTNAQSN